MTGSGGLNQETVDFVFEFTKDAPEQLIRDGEALDTKMVQVFAAASVVMGLAGVTRVSQGGQTAANWMIVGSLVLYLATAILAFLHLDAKEWRHSRHADTLWPEHWSASVADIRWALVGNFSEAYAVNKAVLAEKASAFRWAVATTAGQVILVGVSLIVSRLA